MKRAGVTERCRFMLNESVLRVLQNKLHEIKGEAFLIKAYSESLSAISNTSHRSLARFKQHVNSMDKNLLELDNKIAELLS